MLADVSSFLVTFTGVMTELLHLMNAVANQGSGSEGRKWQHPSDLTRRYADAVGGEGQVDWYVWVGTKTKRNTVCRQLIIIYI